MFTELREGAGCRYVPVCRQVPVPREVIDLVLNQMVNKYLKYVCFQKNRNNCRRLKLLCLCKVENSQTILWFFFLFKIFNSREAKSHLIMSRRGDKQ